MLELPSPGSATDHLETQAWEMDGESYVDTWLAEQRNEHAARIEAAEREAASRAHREQERKRKAALMERLQRREQLVEEDEQESRRKWASQPLNLNCCAFELREG